MLTSVLSIPYPFGFDVDLFATLRSDTEVGDIYTFNTRNYVDYLLFLIRELDSLGMEGKSYSPLQPRSILSVLTLPDLAAHTYSDSLERV